MSSNILAPTLEPEIRIATPATATKTAPGPRGSLLLGSVGDFKRDIIGAMMQGWRDHGDLVRYRLGPVSVYGVSRPNLAEEVLLNGRVYGKLGPDNPLRLVLGNGLLTSSDHDSWLKNRRMVQPIFHRTNLQGLFGKMTQCAAEMVDRWNSQYQSGDVMDLHVEMMRVTLDIVSQCMFSTNVMNDLDKLGPHAVDTAVNFAFQRLQNPLSPPVSWPTPANLRFRRVMNALDETMYRLIAERRKMEEGPGDLLDMLLAAQDEATGEKMSDRQLRDEILTMFAAGHETTAITLTWAVYLLTQHPEMMRQVQAEVDAVCGDQVPTLEDLPNLPFTLQVFEEAMRLYPSAPIIPRLTTQDTTLDGYHLPAGSRVLVNLFNIHRHENYWVNPEKFDPDRFRPENKLRQNRYAYIPFGSGAHLCVGKNFALLEAQMLLAVIAQRFDLRHLPEHRVVNHATITLRPKYGMQMTIFPRRTRRAASPNATASPKNSASAICPHMAQSLAAPSSRLAALPSVAPVVVTVNEPTTITEPTTTQPVKRCPFSAFFAQGKTK